MELFTDLDYLSALTQQYGGADKFYSDRYVFNSQEGNGFGSALSSLGSWALPVLKKVLPFLKNAGKEAIKGAVQYAVDQATEKTATKRKAEPRSRKSKRVNRNLR